MIRGSSIKEKKAWPGIVDWYWRRRFAWLFGSLLVTVGIYPSIQVLGFASTPIRVALAANLLLIIAIMVWGQSQSLRVKVALGAAFVGSLSLLTVAEAVWVAAALLGTVASVHRALQPGPTDGERIFAALDAYLLVGLLFGVWYGCSNRRGLARSTSRPAKSSTCPAPSTTAS